MDTTNQYSNILKAVGESPTIDYGTPPATTTNQQPSFQISSPKLSLEQQAQNYDTFSEMMKQGIYLPDLVKTIEDLKSEVDKLKNNAKAEVDSSFFEAMEASVKGDARVRTARQRMADVKTDVLTEICMKDPRFKDAYEGYRRTVNEVYIERTRCGDVETSAGDSGLNSD